MKIHKEGYSIIWVTIALAAFVTTVCVWALPPVAAWIVAGVALFVILFVTSFFRCPSRKRIEDPNLIFAPADGKVVVIEEVTETEYFHDRRLLVSVFMSLSNVHINWFPVGGRIEYFRHHQGRFLVAWHPKSSEENERTTTVVDMGPRKVLFRQIAGLVARRIVSYAHVGEHAGQNTQCGFIKFGSRVDVYLPVGTEVLVKLGDKVTGSLTPIARFTDNLDIKQ